MPYLKMKLRLYWPLIKSFQTGLLLTTGLAGFMSTRCPILNWQTVLAVTGSLFLAISGSTILNMWYDRDIDAKMERTKNRPLPSGKISPREAFILGLVLALLGVGWAVALDPLYGFIVFAGLFFDVVIYTMWLKRRTPWGIVWGGIAGGMPVLAGRALGTGEIEWIGILLALAVLFWIPTHILTFSMRYHDDYQRAGIPTFPSAYGNRVTQITIAISSMIAAIMMIIAAYGVGLTFGYLRLMVVLSFGLLLLAIGSATKPSKQTNFGLFKYASLYMLSTMVLMMLVAG
ncbi:MAG: heme o synthase [Caldilineaceae bacterium]|nr:heme o synthase [Caldilineaceae bacterium]MBP8108201.1 heme o synthase [Caldilineaceae bacterium]MBP8124235.1 heme o synthase [Caldilineaceae bacterium]MBP9074207.1 heme o synthase [Caldilineaceae bacterium]